MPTQFDLVACADDTNALAGSAKEALPDLFVDLFAVGDSRVYAWSLIIHTNRSLAPLS